MALQLPWLGLDATIATNAITLQRVSHPGLPLLAEAENLRLLQQRCGRHVWSGVGRCEEVQWASFGLPEIGAGYASAHRPSVTIFVVDERLRTCTTSYRLSSLALYPCQPNPGTSPSRLSLVQPRQQSLFIYNSPNVAVTFGRYRDKRALCGIAWVWRLCRALVALILELPRLGPRWPSRPPRVET